MPTQTTAFPLPGLGAVAVRTRRSRAGIALLAALLGLLASPMAAADEGRASGDGPARASAHLDFRIVIPETVRFEHGEEQRVRTRQHTSRTVEVVDGRQRVTIARP